jgi:hypothetical protein
MAFESRLLKIISAPKGEKLQNFAQCRAGFLNRSSGNPRVPRDVARGSARDRDLKKK